MRSEPTLGLILVKLLAWLCTIALRIIGIAIGIGLGLGFAIHVRDVLEKLSEEQAKQQETKKEPILSRHNSVISSSTSTTLQARSLGTTTTTTTTGRDSSSYHSLMMDAGYSVPTVVRGQVRATNTTTNTNDTNYHTGNHSGRNNCNRGAQVMKEMFPSLPIDVSNEIGQMVDLIMRDYVASWFSTVDVSVPYTDPAKQPNQQTKKENSNNEKQEDENETCDNNLKRRTMIYTTSDVRTAPFMEVMYDFLAFLFGNFGVTAMDRLNVLRFVMIKMVTVLAKTLSVYRTMRDRAVQRRIADQQQLLQLKVQQQQQQSTRKEESDSTERVVETPNSNKISSTEGAMKPTEEATTSTTGLRSDYFDSSLTCPISEAAVAREFLQAGRLHAAITFGVDVRSLLCAIVDEDEIVSQSDIVVQEEVEVTKVDSCEEIQQTHERFGSEDDSGNSCTRDTEQKQEDTAMSNTKSFEVEVSTLLSKCPICSLYQKKMSLGDSSDLVLPEGSAATKTRRPRHSIDVILTHRLFHTNLLYEAELDYNRVVASQMFRKLVPSRENSSFVIKSMGVEMLAGCVLTPTMSMFSPDYLNYCIVTGLSDTSTAEKILSEEADWRKDQNEETSSTLNAVNNLIEDAAENSSTVECVQSYSADNSEVSLAVNKNSSVDSNSCSNEEVLLLKGTNAENDEDGTEFGALESATIGAGNELVGNATREILSEGFSKQDEMICADLNDAISLESLESSLVEEDAQSNIDDEGSIEDDARDFINDVEGESLAIIDEDGLEQESTMDSQYQTNMNNPIPDVDSGMYLLPLATIAVSEVVSCIEVRNSDNTIDWDSSYAKERVCELVLVTEAAILNGRRKNPLVSNLDDDMFPSLTMVVMEMTADLEGFADCMIQKEKELQNAEQTECIPFDLEQEEMGPDQAESSTLRTVIAAWLQTGNLHKMLKALTSSKYILTKYYWKHAFFNQREPKEQFLRPLVGLDDVEVLVDTLRVLGADNPHISRKTLKSDGQSEFEKAPSLSRLDSDNLGTPSAMLRSWSSQQNVQSTGQPVPGVVRGANNAVSAAHNKLTNVRATMTANRQRITRWVTNKPGIDGIDNNEQTARRANESIALTKASGGMIRADFRGNSHSKLSASVSGILPLGIVSSHQLPRYLDFHRNESFASNLRGERERRLKSWQNIVQEDFSQKIKLQSNIFNTVIHGKATGQVHRDLHQMSQIFYKSTVVVRVAMRRRLQGTSSVQTLDECKIDDVSSNDAADEVEPRKDTVDAKNYIQCTLSVVSARRKIEVPDEDSSFLLRGQPRELIPISVQRDQKNTGRSFKRYAASYDLQISAGANDNRGCGGRYIRPCLLQYFPADRTALVHDMASSHVDRDVETKEEDILISSLGFIDGVGEKPTFPTLPSRLSSERNILSKTTKGGTTVNGIMEPSDFVCMPRSGKALDFIYRVSLFEKPVADLAGKRLTIHDSSFLGPHRADASARELSDASLTYAIIIGGSLEISLGDSKYDRIRKPTSETKDGNRSDNTESNESGESFFSGMRNSPENDSTPLIALKMKIAPKGKEPFEKIKMMRPSFVRAALLIASAKQEAQLQCLAACVKAGSARHATKTRAEGLLRPAMCLLEYATSSDREKEQALLRDVGMGITHIDRDQLRRNGMIEPRFPSLLRRIKVRVEDVEYPAASLTNAKPSPIFKLRCLALTEVVSDSREDDNAIVKSLRTYYREEWVIMRPFRDIAVLHKHLKSQVGETAPRFSLPGTGQKKGKVALVPSLQQSSKSVTLTKRALDRRIASLNTYFEELLSPYNLLSGCPEILRFLAADEALPEQTNVDINKIDGPDRLAEDSLGRREIKRIPLKTESQKEQESIEKSIVPRKQDDAKPEPANSTPTKAMNSGPSQPEKPTMSPQAKESLISYIKTRVDEVKLSDVRNSIFFLLRSAFDLDNATFWRSRVFSAIRAMSYVVIGEKDFNKLLIKLHLDFLSGEKIGGLVKAFRECIWPNGIFYTPSPESSEEEKEKMKKEAKQLLKKAMPVQLNQILGEELNEEGVTMLHEMLQNRVVVKSLGYTIADLLWLELFPSLSDILTGTKALDFEE